MGRPDIFLLLGGLRDVNPLMTDRSVPLNDELRARLIWLFVGAVILLLFLLVVVLAIVFVRRTGPREWFLLLLASALLFLVIVALQRCL
jgi:ABC-type polysaccharide/polyol phosphate export permease